MSNLVLPGVDTLPPEAMRQAALGQWDTPPWLADVVAGELPWPDNDTATELHLPHDDFRVLEPSAGLGNVVAALLKRGASHVTAVEIDPLRVAHLRRRFANRPVEVIEGDFLAMAHHWSSNDFDGIAGNPPYDDGCDTEHLSAIADIICREGGWMRASLLLRTVALHGKERGERVWSRVNARVMPVVERVAFGEETGMIDVSVFSIRKGASALHIRRPA